MLQPCLLLDPGDGKTRDGGIILQQDFLRLF